MRVHGLDTAGMELTGIEVDGEEVAMHLLGADGAVTLRSPSTPEQVTALQHVVALHGHGPGCGASSDVGIGLLQRLAAALQAQRVSMLVRPSQPPTYWLRVWSRRGLFHLQLGLLDACALAVSRRVTVEVERDTAA